MWNSASDRHTHTHNHTVHSQAHSLTRLRTPATRGRVCCAGLLKPWACGGDLHHKNTIVPNRQTFEPLGGCWPSGLCFLPHLPASSSSPPPSSFSSLRQKSEFFMSERPGCKSKFKRFRSQRHLSPNICKTSVKRDTWNPEVMLTVSLSCFALAKSLPVDHAGALRTRPASGRHHS